MLHRQDGSGNQPGGVLLREVPDPVVVRPRQGIGDVGVLNDGQVLGEQRGQQQRLVDAHRVHVGEAGLGVGGALGQGMGRLGVQ